MKSIKGFALGLVVGLALAISSIGFAQNATQTETMKSKESCCSMSCCKGDSCNMNHDAKSQAGKENCCCCGGDSCDMKMKEQHKAEQKKQE